MTHFILRTDGAILAAVDAAARELGDFLRAPRVASRCRKW